jgi:glycosyltransferase involved in cell wall biosynthesis
VSTPRIRPHDAPPGEGSLRILRLTPHFFRRGVLPVAFDPVGGLQTQVWRSSRRLAAAGISQTILTSYIPGSARRECPHPAIDVRSVGARIPAFLAGPLLNFSWFLGVLPYLFRWTRSYDAVHIHYNHSIWCRVLAVIAAWTAGPVVVSLNTALWGGLRDLLERTGLPLGITRLPERWALLAADQILALTDRDAEAKAAELRIDRARFTVIPDAIDAGDFGRPPDAKDVARFRERHRIPDDRPVVTYIGRISPEKGWPDLPHLVDMLRSSGAFLFVGGDGPDRRQLEARLDALGRPGDWHITGFLQPEEVRIALHLAAVLVLPSRREAFGSVLLEAMAAAVPAVAYSVGGIAEVAGERLAIKLVPPNDKQALAAAVTELLSDPAAYAALVDRGRTRVGDFRLDDSADALLTIYRTLAGSASVGTTPA